MRQCQRCTRSPLPSLESERDVETDGDKREEHRIDCVVGHILCDRGTDLVRRNDTVYILLRADEAIERDGIGVEALESLVEQGVYLGRSLLRRIVELVLGYDTHLVAATVLLHLVRLHGLVIADKGLVEGLADILYRDIAVETHHVRTAAGKVDTRIQAVENKRDQRYDDQRTRDNIRYLALVDEIERYVRKPILRPRTRERYRAPLVDDPLKQHASDEDRAVERSQDTDDKRGGEALNGTRTEDEEHDTRDDRGKVTVDDGRVGIRESVLDSQRKALAAAQLLLDTFVDDHVGINGHTHRKHDTGYTGQRQYCAERHQHTHKQEDIEDKCHVGHPSRRLVEESHIKEHQHERQHEREHTGIDRLGTQRRADHRILNDAGRSGNLTRLEHVGQVLSLLYGEVTGDARVAAVDLALYSRGRIYISVEDDGDSLADVLPRELCPLRRTGRSHRKVNLGRSATLGIGLRCGSHGTAVHGGLAVDRAQRIESISAVEHILTLDAPLEHQIAREEVLHIGARQIGVHGRYVGCSCGSYDSAASVIGIKYGEKGILISREVGALRALILHRGAVALGYLGGKTRCGS